MAASANSPPLRRAHRVEASSGSVSPPLAQAQAVSRSRSASGSGSSSSGGQGTDARSRSASFAGAAGLLHRLRSLSAGAGMAAHPPAASAAEATAPEDRAESEASPPRSASRTASIDSLGSAPTPASALGTYPLVAAAAAAAAAANAPTTTDGMVAPQPLGTPDARRSVFWRRWTAPAPGMAPTPSSSMALPSPPPAEGGPADAELAFWADIVHGGDAAVKRRAKQVAERVRGGVPPTLRGIVWQTLCNGRDRALEDRYRRLLTVRVPLSAP
jgi:hypothetical protein